MEIEVQFLDDNIEKSKKAFIGETREWGKKRYRKTASGEWELIHEKPEETREGVCDLDDGDGWMPGPKNMVGKLYMKDGVRWKVVSADLKAGTARCATTGGKYESRTRNLKELEGETFEKSVFDEFEPKPDDIKKGVKANIGEIRIWSGKKMKKQANGKWIEVSESHGMTREEHKKIKLAYEKPLKEASTGKEKMSQKDWLKQLNFTERQAWDNYNTHFDNETLLSDKEYDESELDIETKKEEIDEWVLENLKPIKDFLSSNYTGTNIMNRSDRLKKLLSKVDDIPSSLMKEFENELDKLGLGEYKKFIRS